MATWNLGKEESFQLGRAPAGTVDGYVLNAADAADARATALQNTGATYYNMIRMQVEAKIVRENAVDSDWYVVVKYGLQAMPKANEVKFSASSKGGREKVTLALSTFDEVGYDPGSGVIPAPDTQGAIGVDSDGNVSGTEVIVPMSTFSLEVHVNFGVLDNSYWSLLEEMTGTVNKSNFFGRRPHTVRFDGFDFDGTIRLDQNADQVGRLRFDFSRSKSELWNGATGTGSAGGVVIPGLERAISKRGFDYLDIMFGEFEDTAAKQVVRRPIAAYSRQVSPEANFARLGIGT